MAKYKITMMVDGPNINTVTKKAEEAFGPKLARVQKVDLAKSRADRLAQIAGDVDDCRGEVESLKEELQDWYDNLPESFQSGEKGDALQSAIDSLQEIEDSLEGVDFDSVEFPSMF